MNPTQVSKSKKIYNHLLSHQHYVQSTVSSGITNKKEWQDFKLKVAGLHSRNCKLALRKISRYENYNFYLDFVKKAEYNEKKQMVKFYLSSYILPFDMILNFQIPRINKPGIYSFTFKNGFLKGLTGKIHASNFVHPKSNKKQCFLYLNSHWSGPKTRIPDIIFEVFTSTIVRIGMIKLFKISSHP